MFGVQDYITEIRVPKDSPSVGKTVRELENLIQGNFVVIGMIRKKTKRLVIPATQVIEADDILIIEASTDDLGELVSAGKLGLVGNKEISSEILKSDSVSLLEAVIPQGSRIENRSSQQMRLRSRYQINLLAIAREGRPFKQRLHQVNLHAGDVVLLQGPSESLRENAANLGFLSLGERDISVGTSNRLSSSHFSSIDPFSCPSISIPC